MGQLPSSSHKVNRRYDFLPFLALEVAPDAFWMLQANPLVKAIHPDMPIPLPEYGPAEDFKNSGTDKTSSSDFDRPAMSDTIGLIGADRAWARGYTGSGWHVAILDTGIRRTHEFFQGKSIVEACFSLSGHCPNGQTSMTGTGAAAHYSSTYQGYDHGTHVAGTAAGKKPDNTLFGVARDAGVIAINVFSKFSAQDCGGSSPCVMSYTSDQLAGLNHAYGLRTTYNIGAANMSLGGGTYSAYCDGGIQKTAIDLLLGANIPTAIATGNNGYCGAVGSPSCISTAVAVMASTKADIETWFSNWHATIGDVFAPGQSIRSATGASDTSYGNWDGTSMATPHVAGGLTVMRHAYPSDSVADLFVKITEQGPSIPTLCSSGGSKPRIFLDNFPTPGRPTLISPSGTITTKRPTYTWNAVSGSTWYYLWVDDSTGNRIKQWYTATQTGCAGGTGTCSITPAVDLSAGSGKFWVHGWNASGSGPWSAAMNFTVNLPTPPGRPTLVSPSGTIEISQPTYTWNAVSGSTWYYLWVDDATGNRIKQWYTASQTGCAGGTGTCSITPDVDLSAGSAKFWVHGWNASGNGPWSAAMNFTVNLPTPPGRPTLDSPSGTITTSKPTYTWNAVSGADSYLLWVNDVNGNRINQWYTATQTGCAGGTGTCSITPAVDLAAGSGKWWVQARNAQGTGPWSAAMDFTVNLATPPGRPTLVSPSGTITASSPTYTWNAVSGATWYQLYVSDANLNTRVLWWYTASETGCASGTGTCSITPDVEMPNGNGRWRVRANNAGGTGPWSEETEFTVNLSPPGKVTLVSPSGTIATNSPTYTWNAVAGATWYYLWVDDATGNRIKQWYTATQTGCPAGTGTCSITPSVNLAAGNARFWVHGWNQYGNGPWSDRMDFRVQ